MCTKCNYGSRALECQASMLCTQLCDIDLQAAHKRFLCDEILISHQVVKVFSLESFPIIQYHTMAAGWQCKFGGCHKKLLTYLRKNLFYFGSCDGDSQTAKFSLSNIPAII